MKILMAMGFVSLLFAFAVSAARSRRLVFIKAYILMTAFLPLSALVISLLSAGEAVGSLLPPGPSIARAAGSFKILQPQNSALPALILLTYAFIASGLLLKLAVSYFDTRRRLARGRKISMAGGEAYACEGITSPFSFGLFPPRIYVPADFSERNSPEAVRMALAHERNHIRSGDPAWKILSLAARAAVFFSPAAWWLHRRLDLEMEIECDRRTIENAGVTANAYGHFLLDALAQSAPSNPLLTYMSETNIKRRITAMKTKRSSGRVAAVICGLIAALGSVTAIAASAGVARFSGQYMIKAQILVDGQLVSTPQIVTLSGEEATIEMKTLHPETELKLKIVASDYAELADAIELKMSLEYKNSDRKFSANPHMAVMPGEEGTVTLASDAKGSLEMKIKAERQ
jgi:hypothetical protein